MLFYPNPGLAAHFKSFLAMIDHEGDFGSEIFVIVRQTQKTVLTGVNNIAVTSNICDNRRNTAGLGFE